MEERYGCWEGEGEEKRWAWGGRELVICGGFGFFGLWLFLLFCVCCPCCGCMCCVKVGRESSYGGRRRGIGGWEIGAMVL